MATLEDLLEKARGGELKKPRKRSLNEEHQLQCAEVRYMRGVHNDLSHVFFLCPERTKENIKAGCVVA